MKRYYQNAFLPSLIALICSILFIIAGIFFIIFMPEAFEWILFFIGFGVPAFFISAAIFIPVICTPLIIENEKIIFPITRMPKVAFRKNVVKFSDIESIKSVFRKGDGVVACDSYFYEFTLVSGLKFTENLQSYFGKRQEKEIIEFLKNKNIKFK